MRRYELAGCPVCGETAATTVADPDQITGEVEELWAFHTRRLHAATPPERLHDRVAFSQAPPLRVAMCDGCTLLYRNPREKAETLLELYGGEEPDTDALDALFANQLPVAVSQLHRLERVIGSSARGLEVGSYIGCFLSAAAAADWSFEGVDVNDSANAYARSRGLSVTRGTIDDVAGEFDVVAFWNCFDQLPDPLAAARRARELLSAGGWMVVRVPNGAFYARWRKRLTSRARPLARALLAYNNLLGFPYRHGFTLAALQKLLDRTGFSLEHAIGDALVPIADDCTRAWARAEERLLKSALRRLAPARAPWLEVYARAR